MIVKLHYSDFDIEDEVIRDVVLFKVERNEYYFVICDAKGNRSYYSFSSDAFYSMEILNG